MRFSMGILLAQNAVLLTFGSQSPVIPYVEPPRDKDDADVSGTGMRPMNHIEALGNDVNS